MVALSSSTDSESGRRSRPQGPFLFEGRGPVTEGRVRSCHSGVKRKAGLDATSYDSLMKFVKAGDPANSKLYKSLTGKGETDAAEESARGRSG